MYIKIKKCIIIQILLLIFALCAILIGRSKLINYFPACFFKEHFSIICPMCGVTRFFISSAYFNFIEAFKYHPTMFVFCCYVICVDIIYIINTLFNKNYAVKLYPSLNVLFCFLSMLIIQYVIKIMLISNGITNQYLI